MKKCNNINCQKIIENDNAKFCRYCGTRLTDLSDSQRICVGELDILEPKDNEHICISTKNDGILLDKESLMKQQTIMSSTNKVNPSASPTYVPNNLLCEDEDKRSEPQSKITFTHAIKTCFSKYASFKGRAGLREYWFFILFYFLVCMVLFVLSFVFIGLGLNIGVAELLIIMVILCVPFYIPMLSVSVRRLHDVGMSGWWLILLYLPILGIVWLFYACKPGERFVNKYGEFQ